MAMQAVTLESVRAVWNEISIVLAIFAVYFLLLTMIRTFKFIHRELLYFKEKMEKNKFIILY